MERLRKDESQREAAAAFLVRLETTGIFPWMMFSNVVAHQDYLGTFKNPEAQATSQMD